MHVAFFFLKKLLLFISWAFIKTTGKKKKKKGKTEKKKRYIGVRNASGFGRCISKSGIGGSKHTSVSTIGNEPDASDADFIAWNASCGAQEKCFNANGCRRCRRRRRIC
jgi:hypothetical protein